jgi:flavin-dependent dehydrogenase
MAMVAETFDVVVLGDHPCTYVAALLLRRLGLQRVGHAIIPTDRTPNRAVVVNPRVFALDDALSPWREALSLTSINGVHFLADDPAVGSAYFAAAPLAYAANLQELAQTARSLAEHNGVKLLPPTSLKIHRSDSNGVKIEANGTCIGASALIVGGNLPACDKRTLGIPAEWDQGVVRRLCYVTLPPEAPSENGANSISMSLDLQGSLRCAWLLQTPDARHLFVEHAVKGDRGEYANQLQYWANVLSAHERLEPTTIDRGSVKSVVLPLAGALVQDNVADRTLLIGPAGGFYTACGEDVFPNVWSAVYAAQSLAEALRQPILQDALDNYRACWRISLGLHLSGHQQNLRFLLPLIYKNELMTGRLAEAILVGRDVVR